MTAGSARQLAAVMFTDMIGYTALFQFGRRRQGRWSMANVGLAPARRETFTSQKPQARLVWEKPV
jgi:hypothetical protein